MLARITLMLKRSCITTGEEALNKGSLEFSNNSHVIASATGSSIRGMSVGILYLDEFAFCRTMKNEFYTST